jgi:hypothetical protein
VYFPGYGWVEFEPTVSQSEIIRPEGDGRSGTGDAGADAADAASDPGEGGEANPDDVLRGLPEDIEIPEEPLSPVRWVPFALAGLAAVAGGILLTPARAVVAKAALEGSRRAGFRTPRWIEDWAVPPKTEAARVFRRLATWVPRVTGESQAPAATPHEQAAALASVLPGQVSMITEIVEAYTMERYGGRQAHPGTPSRAWRSLSSHLYRARWKRWLDGILGV